MCSRVKVRVNTCKQGCARLFSELTQLSSLLSGYKPNRISWLELSNNSDCKFYLIAVAQVAIVKKVSNTHGSRVGSSSLKAQMHGYFAVRPSCISLNASRFRLCQRESF